MKRVLLLGVSGFTGYHFDRFAERTGLAREFVFIGADSRRPQSALRSCSSFHEIDATDSDALVALIAREEPQYIANFIGLFHAQSYNEYVRHNVDVSRHILNAVSRNASMVERILLVGSAAEYGQVLANPVPESAHSRPVSLYGLSKTFQTAISDFYFRVFNVKSVVARTFNIVGEGISPHLSVGSFLKQIREARDGDTIQVGNLDTERDFLPIEQVVSHYWDVMMYGQPGEVYNVCSGRPTRIGAILEQMIRESGKKLKVARADSLVRTQDIPCIYGDRSKLDSLLRSIPQRRTPI